MKKTLLTLAIVCAVAGGANAAVLLSWDFSALTGGTNDFGPSPFAGTAISNSTAGGLTRGSGISTTGGGASNAWGGTGFITTTPNFANALAASEFVTFTLKANVGYALSFASIDAYNIRRSGTGPTTGQWQYSLNGTTFTDIGSTIAWGTGTSSAGNAQSAISLTGISALQNVAATTTVTFRLVTWGATNSGGTWYFNDPSDTAAVDLGISGTLAAVPEPSTTVLLGAGLMVVMIRRRHRIA